MATNVPPKGGFHIGIVVIPPPRYDTMNYAVSEIDLNHGPFLPYSDGCEDPGGFVHSRLVLCPGRCPGGTKRTYTHTTHRQSRAESIEMSIHAQIVHREHESIEMTYSHSVSDFFFFLICPTGYSNATRPSSPRGRQGIKRGWP